MMAQRDEEVRVSPIQPTQFIIGGGSSAASGIGASSAHGRSGNHHHGSKGTMQDELNEAIHPLQKLQPDQWNNIPICLVRAVKSLIDSGIATD